MMRLLSIDVGIKNLAACLFTISESSYEIEAWDVFDLTKPISDTTTTTPADSSVSGSEMKDDSVISSSIPYSSPPSCCFEKKPCKRPVAFHKFGQHFCVMHAKKSSFLMPTPDWKPSKLRTLNKSALAVLVEQHKIDLPNTSNNKQNYLDAVLDYAKMKTLEPVIKPKASQIDLVSIGQGIVKAFHYFLGDSHVNAVIIENQISPIASRMKTIQGMIAQYFIMKGVSSIEFVSASNKLKGFTLTSSSPPKKFASQNTIIHDNSTSTDEVSKDLTFEEGDYDIRAETDSDDDNEKTAITSYNKPPSHSNKQAYNSRKHTSVQIVKNMLEKNSILSKWNLFFIEHKKKDDLADCFLQGLWYIREKTIYS